MGRQGSCSGRSNDISSLPTAVRTRMRIGLAAGRKLASFLPKTVSVGLRRLRLRTSAAVQPLYIYANLNLLWGQTSTRDCTPDPPCEPLGIRVTVAGLASGGEASNGILHGKKPRDEVQSRFDYLLEPKGARNIDQPYVERHILPLPSKWSSLPCALAGNPCEASSHVLPRS